MTVFTLVLLWVLTMWITTNILSIMKCMPTNGRATGRFMRKATPVSYTHLDVYKRQLLNGAVLAPLVGWGKNRAALNAQKASFEAEVHSYEKTDVYKRQGIWRICFSQKEHMSPRTRYFL